jgi:REP element-mobilizing transposase RayT
MEHKYWHSRGYLPHFDSPGLIQGITYRLCDSLPTEIINSLKTDAKTMSDAEKRAKIEVSLNAGYGACYLAEPRIARMIEESWLHFDGKRYKLIAWVVMPNHVHVMIETFDGYPLDKVIHSWKSFTTIQANSLLQREGRFWFHDYFDRYIRDEQHFKNAVYYIHNNPVLAGLVDHPEDWPYGSARLWLEDT